MLPGKLGTSFGELNRSVDSWRTTENQALHPDTNDLENNFLKNNSRKKTYDEVIQATTMEDSSCDEDEDDLVDHSDTERSTDQQTPREDIHP